MIANNHVIGHSPQIYERGIRKNQIKSLPLRWRPGRAAVLLEPLEQFGGFLLPLAAGAGPDQRLVAMHRPLDPPAGADDGAVIALAHLLSDFGEAELGGFADQEHGHAAGQADRPLAAA